MSVKTIDLNNGTVFAEVTVAVTSPALVDEDILAGPCKVHSMQGEAKANAYTIRMWNKKSPTLASDAPDEQHDIPTGGLNLDFGDDPLEFETGLSISATNTGDDTGSGDDVNMTNNAAVINLILSKGV